MTGSGKTFTVANVIAAVNLPTLVLAPNKTLAAQLYGEFQEFFPENAVEYFVSYYDYYQPEAYVPQADLYIEKDSSINEAIDRMRHSATRSLFDRNDVIIVASVSCIYGLGSPEAYHGMLLYLEEGMAKDRREVLAKLVEILYERNDIDFHRGTFRVRGDRVEIFPAYEEDRAIRIEFWGDTVETIREIDPLRGQTLRRLKKITVYPASHYVTTDLVRRQAMAAIEAELSERLAWFQEQGKLLEAQRLEERTRFDLEMMKELGFCHGIENYSRHLTGRAPGEPPPTLLDYLPRESLVVIDESHITIPQLQGMYRGDRSRKQTLVDYGFRLPSALDNRPLSFEEFEARVHQMIYVSATPGPYEMDKAGGRVVEQIVRPTGLMDPEITREARQPTRWTISWARSGPGCSGASGCWSPLSPSAWPKTSPSTTRTWASRCATSIPTSPPWSAWRSSGTCAWGSSTSWWASTSAGRAGSAGSLPGGHPGRGQGGLPALRPLPDPDLRPGGPQRPGRGALLRRPGDPLHGRGHRGDRPAPGRAARLQ